MLFVNVNMTNFLCIYFTSMKAKKYKSKRTNGRKKIKWFHNKQMPGAVQVEANLQEQLDNHLNFS